MDDRFSATIGKIYAAAGGEKPWEDALHSIEDLTASVGAVIGFVPVVEGYSPFNIAGRFTAEQCATYSQSYQSICRRTRFMMDHPLEEAIYDSLLITEQEMDRDPVYDWFGQHDLRYFVGSSLPRTQTHYTVFSLQRSAAQGHVQSADVDLFKQIKSHLGRAITLADQLNTLRSRERLGSAIVEGLPHAVFALDASGLVVQANTAALKLLATADGLAIANGHLRPAQSDEQGQLDRLVGEAANAIAASSGWTKASRASGAAPYALFVAPLPGGDESLLVAGAAVLVIVHDPGARNSPDPEVLTSVYGLTETEARLACAIATGHSLETAAATLAMGVGTARFHLKHMFAKLGVNRQQDLVGLLTSLSSLKI